MAERSPAFQFYPKDWLASARVMMMGNEAQGAYINLLAHQWLEQSLPGDEAALALLSGAHERWGELCSSVMQHFVKQADGTFVNLRLEKERTNQENYRKIKAAAGRKSGKVRRRKALQGEHNANTRRTQREHKANTRGNKTRTKTNSPSPSPSPSSFPDPSPTATPEEKPAAKEKTSSRHAREAKEIAQSYFTAIGDVREETGSKRAAVKNIEKLLKAGTASATLQLAVDNYGRERAMQNDPAYPWRARNFFGRDGHWEGYVTEGWKPCVGSKPHKARHMLEEGET